MFKWKPYFLMDESILYKPYDMYKQQKITTLAVLNFFLRDNELCSH